jgi:hypothetical protein
MLRFGKLLDQFWEYLRSAFLKHLAQVIVAGLFLLFGVVSPALRTWLVTLHSVTLWGVLWLSIVVALVLVVYWAVRGFVGQRRATQPMPEWVEAVGAKLDDLILDLQPCLVTGNHTSIYEAFHSSSTTRDELWNQTHYLLSVVGAWFREWDGMRQAVGTQRTPKILVQQFESLNALLMNLGLVAPDVRKRFEDFPANHHARVSFGPVADRYNHFLTEYEALLRRLPQEAGLNPPPLGGERIFIRL